MTSMMRRACYHAQRGYYGLCRGLGLLTRAEYDELKDRLRRGAGRPWESGYMVAHRGGGFRRGFGEYFDKNGGGLHEKYLRLVCGLDEESQGTVQLALSRLMEIYGLRPPRRRVRLALTSREAAMLRRVEDELHSRVARLPDGTFAHRDWLLPHWEMHAEALFHRHFVEELGCLDRVRGRDILDVGAFIGDSALALQDYTDRKVYSFDPNPMNIRTMRETIRLNGSTKIVPVPLGLGDRDETLRMPADRVSGTEGFSGRGEPVKVTTLDEWARGSDVDIGLIKVDIEGYEQRFLRGALETLRKHRPAMLLCIYHSAADLFEIKPFIDGLGLGYRFKIRQPAGHYIGEMTLICEPGGPGARSPHE